MKFIVSILCVVLLSSTCNDNNAGVIHEQDQAMSTPVLDEMWYRGKAEISSFTIKQNRYNALHEGELVMIFVSEDFLEDKQVKNDNYTSPHTTPILKNNRIRKFNTGLYDYSVFTSVFTDVKNPKEVNTLKVTMSSQDWCGQSFSQLNFKGNKNVISSYSYFEKEGDENFKIDDVFLLDEVFNLIRLGKEYLPTGTTRVAPSFFLTRLRHKAFRPYEADCRIVAGSGHEDYGGIETYRISIPELEYTIEIDFRDSALREIIGFRESYPSAFDGIIRTTTAVLKARVWSDYWTKNSPSDLHLRDSLKLDYTY